MKCLPYAIIYMIEIGFNKKIKLEFKKFYYDNKCEYSFVLCCLNVVNLVNPCPKQCIALKIPKCIKILDTIADIVGDYIIFEYKNIGLSSAKKTAIIEERSDSWLIHLETNKIEIDNKLCINNIYIPITIDCLPDKHKESIILNELGYFISVGTKPVPCESAMISGST